MNADSRGLREAIANYPLSQKKYLNNNLLIQTIMDSYTFFRTNNRTKRINLFTKCMEETYSCIS